MARRPTSRPWTRLLSLAILIIAAFATILGAGYTPKLGLDLAGGTTVTLKPSSLTSKVEPSKSALDEAVNILRERVNGNGVGGATVQEQYPYIVASVPSGTRSDVLAKLSRTAQLYFRQVAVGCTATTGTNNCTEQDPTLIPPAQLKKEEAAFASAQASASAAAAASASAHPSASSTTSASPTVLGATPATSAGASSAVTPSATVVAPASSTASAPAAAPSATTHNDAISQALVAATASAPAPGAVGPTPATSPITSAAATVTPTTAAIPTTATSASAPTSSGAPTTTTAPVPAASPTAPANPAAPLPAGTGVINWTQAEATAAFATLQCGNPAQSARLGDFTATSWALGCGTGNDTNKYILMPAAVKGTSVKTAVADPETTSAGNQQITTGGWEVNISFKDEGFQKLTTTTAGGMLQVAIVLDGLVESAPVNTSAIVGDAQITGSFTQSTATDLANTLKFGSLPLSFNNAPQTETVSASLGKSSLNAGLLAGAIGLAIVVLYCFFYYRALGIVTVLSLAVSGSMVYASVVLLGHAIGFTLSLAGIAGFIVAIGITADSFVVYYERIKDEMRDGRAARSAVESGWRAARRTIISADSVSLLAAIVLYVVTIGDVRGFALTLGLSTALDLVTVFFFTKPLVTLLIQRPLFSTGKMSGLTADAPQAPLRRRAPGRDGATVGRRPSSAPDSEDVTPDVATSPAEA